MRKQITERIRTPEGIRATEEIRPPGGIRPRKGIRAAAVFVCAAGLLACAGCGDSVSGETDAEIRDEAEAAAEAESAVAVEAESAAAPEESAAVNTDKLNLEFAEQDGSPEDAAGGDAADSGGNAADAAGESAESAGRQAETGGEETDSSVAGTRTLTISATGDCTFGVTQEQGYDGTFNAYYDSYGPDYFLSGVRDIFAADDLTIINLECVLTTSEDLVEKAFNLKGRPEYVGIMTGSSVEAATMGNNHTYDYGDEGFEETRGVLEEAGITYAYSGQSGMFVSDEGVKVGIVAANMLPETDEKLDTMIAEMQELRADGAEVVIACCHWGIEKNYYPTDYQVATAHALIDAGADLIIGSHPHVLQGVEVYRGKVICYSLGNFCFGGNMDPEDKNTMIFQQTFTIVDGELKTDEIDARIIPCRLSSADSYNNFQPVIAGGDRYAEIIGLVNEYSSMFGSASFDGEGSLLTAE